jgi:hypothetical protein
MFILIFSTQYDKLSIMSDNKGTILEQLKEIGLTGDEAKIYLRLLEKPSTHLKLSRDTGIARTKVYRIADELSKRSLIAKHTDDRGTFLVAADPATLEVEVATQEARLTKQRSVLNDLLPALDSLASQPSDSQFVVRTYEGERGLKQMWWHELKTKGELLTFGYSTIEMMIPNHRWAEKHRALAVKAGYGIRDLLNDIATHKPTFTGNEAYLRRYQCRAIAADILPLNTIQIVTYNDTTAFYHREKGQLIGVEIINHDIALVMRTMFEAYWRQAVDVTGGSDTPIAASTSSTKT